jgi:uncharacterized protein
MLEWISQPWPWYVAGVFIGLTVPALLLLGNKTFGISSSLQTHLRRLYACENSIFQLRLEERILEFVLCSGHIAGWFFGSAVFVEPRGFW